MVVTNQITGEELIQMLRIQSKLKMCTGSVMKECKPYGVEGIRIGDIVDGPPSIGRGTRKYVMIDVAADSANNSKGFGIEVEITDCGKVTIKDGCTHFNLFGYKKQGNLLELIDNQEKVLKIENQIKELNKQLLELKGGN